MKKIFNIIFSFTIVIFALNTANAQNCQNGDFCEVDDMGDYDYYNQSVFGFGYPGDTIVVKTALYANKKYNVWVCGVPELGDLKWRIVKPVRRSKKTIKAIKVDTTVIYEMTTEWDDESEEDIPVEKYDKEGNPIVKGVEIQRDTLFNDVRYTDEVEIFSSAKTPNYEKSIKKTQRIWVKFVIPKSAAEDGGCYGVYIGRTLNSSGKRKFKRGRGRKYR